MTGLLCEFTRKVEKRGRRRRKERGGKKKKKDERKMRERNI
jgi:hypothetical protein